MWILDYASYHPGYDPSLPEFNRWRENLLTVDVNNAEEYCKAMEARELRPEQIPYTFSPFGPQARPTFVVNFDERLYVNGWHDNIPLHDYVPPGWTSIEADPYDFVPSDVRALWQK